MGELVTYSNCVRSMGAYCGRPIGLDQLGRRRAYDHARRASVRLTAFEQIHLPAVHRLLFGLLHAVGRTCASVHGR